MWLRAVLECLERLNQANTPDEQVRWLQRAAEDRSIDANIHVAFLRLTYEGCRAFPDALELLNFASKQGSEAAKYLQIEMRDAAAKEGCN